jgi:O-6-methylguanine DNA methyltransferase
MNLEADLKELFVDAPAGLAASVLAEVGLADRYAIRPGPIGDVFVAFNDQGVTALDLADSAADFEERYESIHGRPAMETSELPAAIARHLNQAIADGRPGKLPVDLSGLTEFQQAVLRRAATIPKGEVRPYGWIAKEIGRPRAVRAVGSALARNPVPVIIPCHRVVRSDGTLGKYSLGADENKRVLLEMEGIDVDEMVGMASRGVRYVGSDTTHIFCHPTCRNARRITDAHRVEFHSEADAEDAGYRACKVCRPAVAA